jgi:opacity protein-like surface antigen
MEESLMWFARSLRVAVALALLASTSAPGLVSARPAAAADTGDLERRIDQLQSELDELRSLLKAQQGTKPVAAPPPKTAAPAPVAAPAPAAAAAAPAVQQPVASMSQPAAASPSVTEIAREIGDRVKIGGYGSGRFEAASATDQKNTFTFRRFVLTVDANIAPRFRSYVELEFEHFRKLELEKQLSATAGDFTAQSAVEGTDDSEISLEQAWVEFEANRAFRLRAGAVLVPLGRFNLNHDDNRWDIPRRTLVDRGVPVLPSTAAWDEIGVGFNGDFDVGSQGQVSYQLYALNGVLLDSDIEHVASARVGDTTLIETEVELSPSTGTFNVDRKDAKAVAGRLLWSPTLGSELAGSFYWGRYTPDFLPDEDLYSLSVDGRTDLGPFEIEGEYVFTHFGGVTNVARGLARRAINQESAIENETTENEVDFELAGLASDKQGYWLEVRHRFWPEILRNTIFGRPFENPQFVAVLRGEQVWLRDLVSRVGFENTELTEFDSESRLVNRITLGLAYRPTPLVVFSLAYEYTRTNAGKSLSSVTNFLATPDNENHSFLAGAAFGF